MRKLVYLEKLDKFILLNLQSRFLRTRENVSDQATTNQLTEETPRHRRNLVEPMEIRHVDG